MLHFDQYFRLLWSDLMYGGDNVMNYVIFCSRVKIGGAGTFSAPPSSTNLVANAVPARFMTPFSHQLF